MNERIYIGKLYRFLDFKGAEITLKEQKLRLTRPDLLNDPLDCSFLIIKDAFLQFMFNDIANKNIIDKTKGNKFVEKHLELVKGEDYQLEGNKSFKKITQDFYITSFSKEYNSSNSYLLWSHYADKHKGICIEFDFSSCLKIFNNNMITPFLPYEIRYVPKLIKASMPEVIIELIEPWLLQKLTFWEYENEIRILIRKEELKEHKILFNKAEKDKFIKLAIPQNSVSKIIFGCKADERKIEQIKSLCVEHRICNNFEKMIIDTDLLELRKVKI